jgi:hypothetical protein
LRARELKHQQEAEMTIHKEWVVEICTLASVGVMLFMLVVTLYHGCQHRPVPVPSASAQAAK